MYIVVIFDILSLLLSAWIATLMNLDSRCRVVMAKSPYFFLNYTKNFNLPCWFFKRNFSKGALKSLLLIISSDTTHLTSLMGFHKIIIRNSSIFLKKFVFKIITYLMMRKWSRVWLPYIHLQCQTLIVYKIACIRLFDDIFHSLIFFSCISLFWNKTDF